MLQVWLAPLCYITQQKCVTDSNIEYLPSDIESNANIILIYMHMYEHYVFLSLFVKMKQN